MASTLQLSKKELRKFMREKLRSVPQSAVEECSQLVTEHIISSPFFRRSTSVSCYLSMPTGEIDTARIVSEVLRAGKTLFVPKIVEDEMSFLKIYSERDLQGLRSGTWGIKEPCPYFEGTARLNAKADHAPHLDLVLTPGLAFDKSLSRLGHGKGFYDRFFASYAVLGRQAPLIVGLALPEQLLNEGEVPMGAHDRKVDVIVGPNEVIESDGLRKG